MQVQKLSTSTFEEILACFLAAFDGYFVQMPTDPAYYKARWEAAKVDFDYSYGMYDEGQLVGFIIHAIERRDGVRIAFNTGTGVIPSHRGKRVTKTIYDHAFEELKAYSIDQFALEVIIENEKAIKAYESVGFQICKRYECFSGSIQVADCGAIDLRQKPLSEIDWSALPNQNSYSWDFQKETILRRDYDFYEVWNEGKLESYFLYSPSTQYLGQFDVFHSESDAWTRLFCAIKSISATVKIVNVDDRQTDKLAAIQRFQIPPTINQFEMRLNHS